MSDNKPMPNLAQHVASALKTSSMPFDDQVAAVAAITMVIEHWPELNEPFVLELLQRFGNAAAQRLIAEHAVITVLRAQP